VFAVKKYRPYLEDKPFFFPQEFNFRVEHCPENELPDVLSRQPEDAEMPDDAIAIDVPTLLDEEKAAQLADSDFPEVLERWRRIREEGPREPGERSFAAVYEVVDGHLVKRDGQKTLLWVLETTRKRILHEFHDVPETGHPGYEETLRSILGQYTWPTVSRDVRAYVKDCLVCATTKRGPIQPGAPHHAYNPERPWQTIAVDYMGPYESTAEGNKYILVVTDLFTRWVEAFPVKGATTKTTVRLLENEVFCRWQPHGAPESRTSCVSPTRYSRANPGTVIYRRDCSTSAAAETPPLDNHPVPCCCGMIYGCRVSGKWTRAPLKRSPSKGRKTQSINNEGTVGATSAPALPFQSFSQTISCWYATTRREGLSQHG
jgi:hypothetical protein